MSKINFLKPDKSNLYTFLYLGSFLFILVVSLNSLLHAEGDTKTYRNVLIVGLFANILLNPIFIFGFLFIPAFGISGLAISTILMAEAYNVNQKIASKILFKTTPLWY